MVAQLSQHDCQPIRRKITAPSKANTGRFKTKYVLSKQQPLVFVMVDRVGRSNDESLSLSSWQKEKHTYCQVTHYSKRDLLLVWRKAPHFTARLRSLRWRCYGRLRWPFVTKDRLLLKSPPHEVWGASHLLAYGRRCMREIRVWLIDGDCEERKCQHLNLSKLLMQSVE